MATPRIYVEIGERAPQVGGLLSAVTPVDETDPHAMNGVQFLTNSCAMPAFAPGLCDPIFDDIAEEKEFVGIESDNTLPFGLVVGIECGLDPSNDYVNRAEAALTSGESFGVEQALELAFFRGATPTVISGTYDLKHGIAELEQQLGAGYNGRGIIHMTRRAAALAGSDLMIVPDPSWAQFTQQGTRVANGAGYGGNGPNDTAPATGKEWIYGTGQVHVWRNPVVSNMAHNPTENRTDAIAERVYSIAVECVIFALQVTI